MPYPSKRLCVTILGMLITALLICYAIDKVAGLDPAHTDPGKWIAAICATNVGAMIAAAWKYVAGETARPSGTGLDPISGGKVED